MAPKVTIIEWGDFQCPYCAAVSPLLKRLADAYPNDVQIVFRHFPLPSHPLALLAAEATEAAGAQGKFWEMEELIFANQRSVAESVREPNSARPSIGYAEQIGLDVKQFNSELDAGKYKAKVQAAQESGHAVGHGRHALPAAQRRALAAKSSTCLQRPGRHGEVHRRTAKEAVL